MTHKHLTKATRCFVILLGASVLAMVPAPAHADQFVLFDVTFTFTKEDADNSKPSKSHYYVREKMLNPNRPRDWTQPVDYRNGTVHIRAEVIDKPAGGEPTTWTLCYIPNKGQKGGYGCTGTGIYREKGVYEQDVKMTSFWQNDSIVWSEGIKQMDLVIKDNSGGAGHAHKRADSEKFFPTKMRITMVQVSAGAIYDPSLVPNLPAKSENDGEKPKVGSAAPPAKQTESQLVFNDPKPQRYQLTARASQLDPRARPHPEIDFVFEKDGKPQDLQQATVDTRLAPQGKLVIWLMSYNAPLFERLASYGLHALRVHYANGWFNKFGRGSPTDDKFIGKIRLEAATGQDFSDQVDIPGPDGMMERALQFVRWLAKENPQGRWDTFLTADQQGLRWDRVIIAGASHGSTTAARFAKHQRVDRVVMLCGPRDQYETWQALPSATPANRYFGFTHVLDDGWSGDHYCRSWELLGLHQFGPIVNVEKAVPPYENSRRLITDADVNKDARRAHNSVLPGNAAVKDASGKYVHEAVWRYLFTHPVETVGDATPADPNCRKELRPAKSKTKSD